MSKSISMPQYFAVGEVFLSAFYTEGKVFLFEQVACHPNGEAEEIRCPIEIPSNSFYCTDADVNDQFEFTRRPKILSLNHDNPVTEVLTVADTSPIRFICTRYILTHTNDITEDYDFRDDFLSRPSPEGRIITGYLGEGEEILIPESLYGDPVVRVELDDLSLTPEITTLIISSGVKEMSLSFRDAYSVQRIELPENGLFTAPPDDLRYTSWYRRQPCAPILLGGYYCGTPGGGAGSEILMLPEGTVGVIPGADFNAYWHKIILPDTLHYIGDYAFSNCPCLTELQLPAT